MCLSVRRLVEAIRDTGATPVLMTFAWSLPQSYSPEAFRAGAVGYHDPEGRATWPAELWGPARYVREGLRAHNAALRRIAAEMDVLLLDQARTMRGDPGWFLDPVHLSEPGADRFVARIARFALAQGLLR